MNGWGFGFSGAIKSLSTTIFTENLADELEDLQSPQGGGVSEAATAASPLEPGSYGRNKNSSSTSSSSDNLQKQMNDIMINHPSIWELFKKELSSSQVSSTNPNDDDDPLIVRKLFEEFLEKHNDEIIISKQQGEEQQKNRSSIFQKALSGIQVAGLQEEEEQQPHLQNRRHHHQDTIYNQIDATATSCTSTTTSPAAVVQSQHEEQHQQYITEIDCGGDDNNKNNSNTLDYENMDPGEMQQKMKLAMSQPELWTIYKKKLSQQPNKRDPETVRNVFIEFLKEHGHKLHNDAKEQQQQCSLSKSRSAIAPPLHASKGRIVRATTQHSRNSRSKQQNSIFNSLNKSFHELNMSLHEEQGRPSSSRTRTTTTTTRSSSSGRKRRSGVQQQKKNNNVNNHEEPQEKHPYEEEKQQQITTSSTNGMQLLRCHPTLYPQFQENLQSTNMVADDFVTDFLKDHEKELIEYEQQQQIDREKRRQQEKEKAKALSSSSSQSIFQSLNMSMHEESMHYYSQPQHLSLEKDAKHVHREEAQKQKQHGHRYRQRRNSHQMYNKETISSRSARKLKVAMDSLAGEVKEEVPSPPHPPPQSSSVNDIDEDHNIKSGKSKSRRRQMMYKKESITSRSARKLKDAMVSLAGEMEEEESISPPKSSPLDHDEDVSRSNGRQMYHRESITNRSARQLKIAMESLAGGMEEEGAGIRFSKGNDTTSTSTRRRSSSGRVGVSVGSIKSGEGNLHRPMMYQRESITSRSARSLKIAIDSLAGEVDDGTTAVTTTAAAAREQHRPEISVDVSKKGGGMQEVDLIGNDDGISGSSNEILTSPSQRIRKSLQTISNRFTAAELVGSFSKGLDLESEVSPVRSSSRLLGVKTVEDLQTGEQTTDDATFHKSCPIHFAPVVEEENNDDDDWVLSEASDIALRRRGNSYNSNKAAATTTSNTTLKTITDMNDGEDCDNKSDSQMRDDDDDDDDDGDRAVASTNSPLLSNPIRDPMTKVTAHGEDIDIATPSKPHVQDEGKYDNERNETKERDERSSTAFEDDDMDSDEGSLI